MKRFLLASAAALAVFAGGQAVAQTVGATTTIELAPPQRTVIKEYVVKQKVKPYAFKERVTVGATLPADVELVTVPSEWGPSVSQYRYVYSDDRVYFVEPSSRRIVHILD